MQERRCFWISRYFRGASFGGNVMAESKVTGNINGYTCSGSVSIDSSGACAITAYGGAFAKNIESSAVVFLGNCETNI